MSWYTLLPDVRIQLVPCVYNTRFKPLHMKAEVEGDPLVAVIHSYCDTLNLYVGVTHFVVDPPETKKAEAIHCVR